MATNIYVGGSLGGAGIDTIQLLTASGNATGFGYLVKADASSLTSNLVVTIPTATGKSGQAIKVIKVDTTNNAIRIVPQSGQTINGQDSLYLYNYGDGVVLTSDGNNFFISSDNKQGTGSTASYLSASLTAPQTTNTGVGNHIKWNKVNTIIGADIILDTATAYVTTNNVASIGRVTLPPNKTFKVSVTNPSLMSGGATYGSLAVFNADTGIQIGNESKFENGGGNNISCDYIQTIIPPLSLNTRIEIRIVNIGGSGITSIGETGYGMPTLIVEEISRETTIINTVDYGLVRYTGTDTGALTTGAKVSFDSTLQNGNMSYAGSMFTLKAGKTYELESFLQIYNIAGATGARFQFWDYTNNVALNNAMQTFLSQDGSATGSSNANGLLYTQHTPSSDIQVGVKLNGSWGQGTGIVGSGNASTSSAKGGTYFKVTQIGSTACTNVSQFLIQPLNYTTTEMPIPQWQINGNQVYSRFISGTTPSSGGNVIFTPSTGSASRLIDVKGWVNRSGQAQRHPIQTIVVDPSNNCAHASMLWQNSTDGSINMFCNNTAYQGQSYEITVYYTK